LLESDVNVKLVASLRQKVKAKVKTILEQNTGDRAKELNRRNVIQKVLYPTK
jgi:signal recognition particle subunit SRP54